MNRRQRGELEHQVLQVLWAADGPCTPGEVQAGPDPRPRGTRARGHRPHPRRPPPLLALIDRCMP